MRVGVFADHTPTDSFTGTLSSQQWNLAIGADGRAYATDGASNIFAVTTGGMQTTLTIPAPDGEAGYLTALFDGHNGYLYAFYNDENGTGFEYIYRISN
jgi:hypothetical protein